MKPLLLVSLFAALVWFSSTRSQAGVVQGFGPLGAGDPPHFTTIATTQGTFRGELVATWDQSIWWNPSPTISYALFDPGNFAPFPGDESIVILDSDDILSITPPLLAPVPPAPTLFQSFTRGHRITVRSLPLEDRSFVITGNCCYHRNEDGYGDFAWDLVKTDDNGVRFSGPGTANHHYLVWGAPVTLPTSGLVIEVVRDQPDNVPGSYIPGSQANLVGVHVDGSYYLYLLHFRAGTIPQSIQPGTYLTEGSLVGEVGNSGVSLEPHLHMTAFYWDDDPETPRYWSVPSEFEDVFATDNLALPATHHTHLVPETGDWLREDAF